MINKDVIVFGYGKFGQALCNILRENKIKFRVAINIKEETQELREVNRYENDIIKFNIEDDNSLLNLGISEDTILITTMDNNHENLFLSLTLRELYSKNYIISISDSSHLTVKLKAVGVNKVLDIYTISGSILLNTLKKPVATKFLQGFINKEHDFIFKEIEIKANSPLINKYISQIDFKKYDIVFIGMIDEELGDQFIFATVGIEHKIDEHDTLVFIGKEENLTKFEKECAGV